MTKREFLDTVFALAPNEANAIMDAFDEYVDSNEPHWIPVTESSCFGITADWNLLWMMSIEYPHGCHCQKPIRG